MLEVVEVSEEEVFDEELEVATEVIEELELETEVDDELEVCKLSEELEDKVLEELEVKIEEVEVVVELVRVEV